MLAFLFSSLGIVGCITYVLRKLQAEARAVPPIRIVRQQKGAFRIEASSAAYQDDEVRRSA